MVTNIVKSQNAMVRKQRTIHVEVPPDTLACVIAVNKEKLERPAAQGPFDPFESTHEMGVSSNQHDALAT